MAKRKKKKKKLAPDKPIASSPEKVVSSALTPKSEKVILPDAESCETPRVITSRGRVSVPVCVAGMLLTLVLGLYLGSLLPGVIEEINAPSPPSESREIAASPVTEPETASPASELALRLEELEAVAAKKPYDVKVLIEIGNLYFDTRQPSAAIKAYEKALELSPQNPDVWTDLGIMYRETGDFKRAVECFRKASAIDPAHRNALYNEGVVLSSDLGDKEGAANAWEKLLKYNPDARAPSGAPIADMIKKLR